MTLGARIKKRRQQLKMTQRELSKISGVRQQTISDIEQGRNCELVTLELLTTTLKGQVKIQWKKNPL